MYRRLKTSLVLVALAAALSAAPASAQSCKAPPGMSAIDQYCEAIPSASGDRGNTDPDRGGVPIPAATKRALERHGADGQAIVRLSAPASKRPPSASPASEEAHAEQPSENPLSAITSSFGEKGDTV